MSKNTKICWKRTMKLDKQQISIFKNEADSDNEKEEVVDDWRTLVPANKKSRMLEDVNSKSKRLMQEGVLLAEQERYWEAITKFNESIELNRENAKLYEMKSQVLLELSELFPAIQSGEMAVKIKPNWSTAHQTLGRAQISYGDIELALRSFKVAFHLDPSNREIFDEDIGWARDLLKEKKKLKSDE